LRITRKARIGLVLGRLVDRIDDQRLHESFRINDQGDTECGLAILTRLLLSYYLIVTMVNGKNGLVRVNLWITDASQ
jgi:hypothetical protein